MFLELRDGRLFLRYNFGFDLAEIVFKMDVFDGKWYLIKVKRWVGISLGWLRLVGEFG